MTEDSLAALRSLVETWRREAAGRALGEPGPGADAARRALGTGHPRDALGEAFERGRCTAAEHAALLGHMAAAAREEVRARAGLSPLRADAEVATSAGPLAFRELLERSFDGQRIAGLDERPLGLLARELDSLRTHTFDAEQEAQERAAKVLTRGAADPDVGEDVGALASEVLDATDELTEELRARAAHALGVGALHDAADLMRVLGAPAMAKLVDPRRRARRIGERLEPLGLQRELAARVQVGELRSSVGWGARVVVLDPPRRVVIRPPMYETGVVSELAMGRAVGVGLAHVLVNPALPVESRRSLHESVPRAFGRLVAGLSTESTVLRGYASDARAAHALGDVFTLVLALDLRRLASAVRSDLELSSSSQAAFADELSARACGVEGAPGALVAAPFEAPHTRKAELRAAALAPALHAALRERYDEDWWRNPRAAEALRAAASRGGSLSVEAWAAELGATPQLAQLRWSELAQR